MHLRVRAVLAVVGAALLLAVFMPPGAQAQEAPTLTVTPSTGLEDGQTVTVTGGPFPELVSPVLVQCTGSVVATDVTSVVTQCDFARGAAPSFDAAGNLLPTSLTVHDVINLEAFIPDQTYDCTVRNDCVIVLAGFLAPAASQLFGVKAPISFGAPTPESKADCKRGGWRDLANDQGQPFRNQGLCLGYVVAHRS